MKPPRWGPSQTELMVGTIAFAVILIFLALFWWIQP